MSSGHLTVSQWCQRLVTELLCNTSVISLITLLLLYKLLPYASAHTTTAIRSPVLRAYNKPRATLRSIKRSVSRSHINKIIRDLEPDSSVSIVSDYGLDGQGSIPDRGTYKTSNLCVQTGSRAHPASCTVGTGGSFPWGKPRPGRDADHSPPSSAEVKKE
jgi:hypothetical protein